MPDLPRYRTCSGLSSNIKIAIMRLLIIVMRKPNEAQTNPQLERREFLVSALATGFAMIVRPFEAQMSTTHGMTVGGASAEDREHDASGQGSGSIMLFLCGDVMTGRGIDQVLPHPGNPVLYERYMKSATGYMELAEEVNGPIPKPVDFSYIWGDALAELERRKPDVRIINLETAITRSDEVENKAVNYRMHPNNIPCITAAGIDCCALANNHVLDWGYAGLAETLKTLRMAGIKMAGAGANIREARAPAVSVVRGKEGCLYSHLVLKPAAYPGAGPLRRRDRGSICCATFLPKRFEAFTITSDP